MMEKAWAHLIQVLVPGRMGSLDVWRAMLGKTVSLEEMRRVLGVNPRSWRMMDSWATKLGYNVMSHSAWLARMFFGAKRPIAFATRRTRA